MSRTEFDKKGQVKLRYETDNHRRISTLRPFLIDAGLYLTAHHYRQDGINAWKLYIKAAASPLLKNDKATDETELPHSTSHSRSSTRGTIRPQTVSPT